MDFRQWFTDTVTIHPISGHTEMGDLEYGDSYEVACRVERGRLRKNLANGVVEVNSHVIWSDQMLSENMHVVLPGESDKRVPELVESVHDKMNNYTLYKIEVT